MKTKKIITLALAVILLFTMIACQDTTNEANVTENEIASNETQDKEDTTILEETVIIEAMNDVNSIIVDTRLNDSYNGWNLDGKPGHLEGSVDFSYNWLSADDDLLIKTLNTKGITSEKNIILYDTDLEHAKKVQTYLENKDFKSVTVFDLNQWSGELASI